MAQSEAPYEVWQQYACEPCKKGALEGPTTESSCGEADATEEVTSAVLTTHNTALH